MKNEVKEEDEIRTETPNTSCGEVDRPEQFSILNHSAPRAGGQGKDENSRQGLKAKEEKTMGEKVGLWGTQKKREKGGEPSPLHDKLRFLAQARLFDPLFPKTKRRKLRIKPLGFVCRIELV